MSKLIHNNKLEPSSIDDYALAEAVEHRFVGLCESYLRIKGVELVPPQDLDGAMLRWRSLRVRHRDGDLRHTMAEMQATREVAEWTVRENAKLRNQSIPQLVWKD